MISNMGHVMTLANSIIGVGILAMPFCFQKCGIVLSILLLILNYLVTRISCHYLIKSSLLTRRKSFELLAFHSFGSSGKLMVELCIIGYLIGTCIAYFVVVGDLGPQIVAKLLNINENDNLRTWVMVIVTFLCIIPLGMLKNVDSLSTVCTASIGFYFCLVLKVIAESQGHIMANDWIGHIEYWRPSGVLQCLPIFSMALSCQMQLYEVFETIPNQSLEKMNSIVTNATRICTCVYILVGLFGYVAFCTQTFSGNILVNFSQSLASDVIKMGFVLSVAFSFPLVIFPCRASIYSLLYRRGQADSSGYIPEKRFKIITVFIALLSLCVGLLIPSIELVIGLVGSTIGVAICIMFPAGCFLKIFKKDSSERSLAHAILLGGFCLMILGTYANLNAIDEKISGPISDYNNEQNPPLDIPKKLESPKSIEQNIKLTNVDVNDINEKSKSLEENLKIKIQEKFIEKTKNALLNQKVKELNSYNVKIDEKPKISDETQPPKQRNNNNNNIVISDKPVELNKEMNLENNKINKSNIKKSSNQNTNVINEDAIEKDEQVAAEEAVADKKSILQNAEIELKKTKELLEKKVDELKLELAMKNEETQNLVVSKLDDIVEKVEEIERKVLEVNEDDKKDHEKNKKIENLKNDNKKEVEVENSIVKDLPNKKLEEKEESSHGSKLIQNANEYNPANSNNNNSVNITSLNLPKQSLIGQMTENHKSNDSSNDKLAEVKNIETNEMKEPPYEPLSYKTGEVLNKIYKLRANLSNRAALPLPLLINQSSKPSEIDLKLLLPENNIKNNNEENIEGGIAKDILKKERAEEKENIETMRREILMTKNDNYEETKAQFIRNKRNVDENFDDNVISSNIVKSCLDEAKIEKLFPENTVNDVFNIVGIKRDLKSLPDT